MRGDFVIKFLEGLRTTIVDIGTAWSEISYKGVRYSSFKIDGYNSRKKYVGFKNLERRGLIKFKDNDRFIFTRKGVHWRQSSLLRYFREKNRNKWDKKWRIVIFDIPQELHKERVVFRNRLKSIGFIALQKSVFAFPYPCNEEMGDIGNKLGIGDYIDILVAESIGSKEEGLLKIWDL